MQGSLPLDIAAVPTLRVLTQILSKAKRGKAPGLDGLISEVFRAAPREAARLLHPLLAKSSLQVQQPLALRGGLLVSFYKGKGPTDELGSQRAILLVSTVERSITPSITLPQINDFDECIAGRDSCRVQCHEP